MKITLQHIFNLAWQRFIVEQASPCTVYSRFEDSYACQYSDGQGGHCAVGLALPEELREDDQTRTFQSIVETYLEWFDISVRTLMGGELRRFQSSLHDGLTNTKTGNWKFTLPEMVERYKAVAREYGLEIPSGS